MNFYGLMRFSCFCIRKYFSRISCVTVIKIQFLLPAILRKTTYSSLPNTSDIRKFTLTLKPKKQYSFLSAILSNFKINDFLNSRTFNLKKCYIRLCPLIKFYILALSLSLCIFKNIFSSFILYCSSRDPPQAKS